MKQTRKHWIRVIAVLAAACAAQVVGDEIKPTDLLSGKWLGNAISYSGYRAGQSPDAGVHPSKAQILEDLRILEKNWKLIRLYGADTFAERTLEVIREHDIDLKMMLGAWLSKEPGNEARNAQQVAELIRLTNAYPDIIIAVNVGNEILINWTMHPVPEERVLHYVRQVKQAVKVPVTVADNYAWWRDHGEKLAEVVDFITIHTYPLWERQDIHRAMPFTIENYESVRRALPGKPIVIGEAGWSTYTEGVHHVPRAGDEQKQLRYYQDLTAWAKKNGITVFVFEAFDEPWKGTGTEGHWGLFSVDRKAKPVMQKLYPDLKPDGPTSPSYPDKLPGESGLDLGIAFRARYGHGVESGTILAFGPGVGETPTESTGDRLDGPAALRFEYQAPDWGGLYFRFDPYNAARYSRLVVGVKAPADVRQMELKAESADARTQVVDLMAFPYEQADGGWRRYTVPLAGMAEVNWSQLVVLGVWNPRDADGAYVLGSYLVDDIHFE